MNIHKNGSIGFWFRTLWQKGLAGYRRLPWLGKLLVICLVISLVVRSLPYLAPIRAIDLRQSEQALEFSDRQGLPLGTLLTRDQNHTMVVALEQVSPHFIQAILAAEDRRFYDHGALDMRAMGRAIAEAIQARHIVSGASTITMQLARMVHPTPRTLGSKAEEIWLSWRLFAGMSRDEILQAYINRLPMGGNIYGVEAAARIYFGTSAHDLTIAQASLLAALPNDPNQLNPYDHWDALKRRQQYVLNQMVRARSITRLQAEQAYREQVVFHPRQQGILAAPHFLFWAAHHWPSDSPSHIRTTLDRPLQQFVEAQIQQILRGLSPHNAHHAAALVLDTHTGEVLAYVGSPDYFSADEEGQNDGVQALRQPGSTLKPFLYELALEKRLIRPNTVLADVPTHYPIPGARIYSPKDYSDTFQGPVRVRMALANSLNVPAVRVLEQVGVDAFLDRLHQLGFAHLTQPPEYYGLGLALGSGEVSLWELAHAYLVMARQGQAAEVGNWKLGERATGSLTPMAYSPYAASTWALIGDMLSDRHARATSFGVDSVLSLPFPSVVKTGTSSDFRDTWTVGFTTDYTVATWVGNFNGEPMNQISGVMGAAPLWSQIMLHLHAHRDPQPLLPPKDLIQRPICAISGARPTPACPTVVQEYLYPDDRAAYEQTPDPFYQAVSVGSIDQPPQYRLSLPEEYNEWLATQSNPVSSGGLRILFPRDGDFFLMASDTEMKTAQRLEFKWAGTSDQPVEWWLNGEKLVTQAEHSLFWNLRPGRWTLEVRSGTLRDQVQFDVQMTADSPEHQGFSVVQPTEIHH